jgi:hypothetical protein
LRAGKHQKVEITEIMRRDQVGVLSNYETP